MDRTTTIELIDARDVDGTPYEAANKAYKNLEEILEAADDCLEVVDILSLNAELQRQHDNGMEMDASEWNEGIVSVRLRGMRGILDEMGRRLELLRRSATFDPSRPLNEEQ